MQRQNWLEIEKVLARSGQVNINENIKWEKTCKYNSDYECEW